MEALLEKYKSKEPAIVFEWQDIETEAEGWVVINSLRGGAAGGGTRMRSGLDRKEVESLAKTMEIKFTISGPPIGGAKSGINFDPNDPRKREVLKRWYQVVTPLLSNYYGTGGDLNIDEVKEVIPITEDLGLWHPQEGIVNGHFQPKLNEKIHLIGQLRQGVSKVIEHPDYAPVSTKKHLVANMVTGYGVAESLKHYYDIYQQTTLEGKKVIIQGWGNVAGAAAYYLAQMGAKIVGIIDIAGGLIKEEGMSFEEIQHLFENRVNNRLTADKLIPFKKAKDMIWEVPADIFVPGAASKLVEKGQIEKLLANGLEAIACGANVPFKDEDIFFGLAAQFADQNCSLIPDFIANAGMARTFAFLMQKDIEISDESIFQDISDCIRNALFEVFKHKTAKTGITKTALDIALNKILDK